MNATRTVVRVTGYRFTAFFRQKNSPGALNTPNNKPFQFDKVKICESRQNNAAHVLPRHFQPYDTKQNHTFQGMWSTNLVFRVGLIAQLVFLVRTGLSRRMGFGGRVRSWIVTGEFQFEPLWIYDVGHYDAHEALPGRGVLRVDRHG